MVVMNHHDVVIIVNCRTSSPITITMTIIVIVSTADGHSRVDGVCGRAGAGARKATA
jgi:hypothetical protein